jgi:hypothetical protein
MRALAICALLACQATAPSPHRGAASCGPCEARADDFARVRVRVVLRDARNRPVPGYRIVFGSEDGAVTGEDGVAQVTFSSARAGPRLVQPRLPDGTPIGTPVAVSFFAGSFPRVELSSP